MLSLIKRKMPCEDDKVQTHFLFRERYFRIENEEDTKNLKVLETKLDLDDVKKLHKWLGEVIEESLICDDCYNFKMPKNFTGEISCTKCNNVIKNK